MRHARLKCWQISFKVATEKLDDDKALAILQML